MPARSKSQQRLFGMVHAYQKGKLKNAPEEVKNIARSISDEDAEHFAKTKHKGLPEKKAYELGFLNKLAELGVDPDAARMKKTAAPAAKRVLPTLRRVKSLLTGSHLKKLKAHRGVLAEVLGKEERNASRLQREYFSLNNSDPLHHVDLTTGEWVGAPNYRSNLSYLDLKGPALSEAERVSSALRPRIDAAKKLYDAAMERFWRTHGRVYRDGVNLERGLEAQIENEQRAVNTARWIAGLGLGAAGALGGAGYGTYKALSGKKKKRGLLDRIKAMLA